MRIKTFTVKFVQNILIWSFFKMVRILLTLFIILPLGVSAQKKDKVEVFRQILSENLAVNCKQLELGKVVLFHQPAYPNEALTGRIGGTVNVLVKIGELGISSEILKIEGSRFFLEIAEKSAKRVRFSPTLCDGNPIAVSALMTYNFIPQISDDNYFFPAKVTELTDVKTDSPYFESISNLTENYQISFGYADKKFYENAPLTRGDFAQFVRMTLDLLFKRAAESKKIPHQIGLVRAFNPQNLTRVNSIKDLGKKQPFYLSVGVLLQTYNIALVNNDSRFQGNNPITKNEVIDYWTNIFGIEAVPVHFEKSQVGEQIFTRGEFALFLHESMQVLSYKVLP